MSITKRNSRPSSSKDAAPSAAYTLTAEEEAALLAEYGVAGAFDDLLRIPAASRFRSEMTGDVNVFLTGARGEEEADDGQGQAGASGPVATKEELLYDPLDQLLLKYTGVFSSAAPNSLLDGVSSVMGSTLAAPRRRHSFANDGDVSHDGGGGGGAGPMKASTPTASAYVAQLKKAKEEEQRLFRIVRTPLKGNASANVNNGDTASGKDEDDADADGTAALLKESDALLSRADECLARPTTAAKESDAEVASRLAQIEEVFRLEAAYDELDRVLEQQLEEDDDEAEKLLRTAKSFTQRYKRRRGSKGGNDEGAAAAEEAAAARPSTAEHSEVTGGQRDEEKREAEQTPPPEALTDAVPAEPSLFAFEMEMTREELAEVQQWDRILEEVAQSKEALTKEGKRALKQEPRASTHPEMILATMDVLEGRHSATLTAIEAHYKSRIANAKEEVGDRVKRRKKEGFLVMDSFEDRMEQLLPSSPSASLRTEPHRNVHALSLEAPQGGRAVAAVAASPSPPQRSTLESIERQAEKALWFVEREAKEARWMRKEDQRMVRLLAERERALDEANQAIADAQSAWQDTVSSLEAEERTAFEAILAKETRHRELARRAASIRLTKAAAALAQSIASEYERSMAQLADVEAAERGGIREAMVQDRESAGDRQTQRERAQRAAAVSAERERRQAFLAEKKRVQQRALARGEEDADTTFSSGHGTECRLTRAGLLQAEKEAVLSWVRANERRLGETVALLTEEIARCSTAPRRTTGSPRSPPSKDPPPPPGAASSAHVLDALSMARLLPRQFASATADPLRAAQYFHTVSLALEDLERIDYGSVKGCVIPVSQSGNEEDGDRRKEAVRVSDCVRVLDMGSNRLSSSLSLPALLRVFPVLEEVNLGDNGLRDLCAGEGESEDVSSSLGDVRPGSASSSSSPRRLRGVVAAQQNACAERCSVRELDISANALSDLNLLGDCLSSSLVVLSVFANKLSSLLPLQRCQRLAVVAANRNRIRSLQDLQSLRLMQELNLCDNDVGVFPDSVAHDNVLLTKLFLSNNPHLAALPSGKVCFLFLQQLFLSHCALQSLPMDAVPWMPSLSVFHLEGNRLTNVAGLCKCPRLTRLNLSFNRLPNEAAVEPLYLCTRVESLDIRGNPCLTADGEGLGKAVRRRFPCLKEFNNESCQAAEGLTSPGDADTAQSVHGGVHVFFMDLRTSLEVESICNLRRVRTAEATEDRLAEAVKQRNTSVARLGGVVGKQLSLEMKRHAYKGDLQRLSDGLSAIRRLASSSSSSSPTQGGEGVDATANRVFINPVYAEKQRAAKERQARGRLAEYLHGLVLMRRAKAELAALQKAHQESEAYRRERAARRIQPLWRGTVLRSRLARVLRNGDKLLDDDDGLQKVDINFEPDAEAFLRPTNIADLVKHALTAGHDADDAAGPPPVVFHRFDVPAAPVNALSGRERANPSNPSAASASPDQPPRAGSAPFYAPPPPRAPGNAGGGARTRREEGGGDGLGRPSSEPRASERPLAPHPPRPPAPGAKPESGSSRPSTSSSEPPQPPQSNAVDPAWGATVAALIPKRQRKFKRIHQESVRKEYIHDPLNAKRQESSGMRKL